MRGFDLRTLRGRLALGYSLGLTVGLVAFAVLSLWLIDRTQRLTLDRELTVASDAVAPVIKVHSHPFRIDAEDRDQFLSVVGGRMSGAVVASDGQVLVSTGATSAAVSAAASRGPALNQEPSTLRTRDGDVRIVRRSLVREGSLRGYVVLWKSLEEIGQLDRYTALAYALAVPLIVLLAMIAGARLVQRGLRPLDDISSTASAMNARDLSGRLVVPQADDELSRLATTLNGMFDRLQAAFDRERRFTSDASTNCERPSPSSWRRQI